MNQGVLINEPQGYLQFSNTNPLPGIPVSAAGAPITDLHVQIGNGPIQDAPSSFIDSGGVYGTIPSSIAGSVPPGTEITVYNSLDQELYSYVTGGANTPTVVSGSSMNTGFEPFTQGPVYISRSPSGQGTTYFDY